MFLGIGSYTFPWSVSAEESVEGRICSADKLLQYAAENNIRFVQLGDNIPLHEWNDDQLKAFKKNADRLNIRIQVGTRKLIAEHTRLYISIAKFLESAFLRIVIDDNDFHPSVAEVIQQIRLLLPELQAANVKLAIENHDRFPAKKLEEIILATDPQLVGICLDTANSLGAGEGIEHIVGVLAPYTVNLHIKDFVIRRVEHKMGFLVEGVTAGEGMLNIPWLITALQASQSCETATLELWSNPEKDLETSIQMEKMKVEKSLQYLKTVIV